MDIKSSRTKTFAKFKQLTVMSASVLAGKAERREGLKGRIEEGMHHTLNVHGF